MSRTDTEQPDFCARYGRAYEAELIAFVARVRSAAACVPGLDIGWKSLLVAELAERISREGGRPYQLVMRDGSAIRTASDAAALFAAL